MQQQVAGFRKACNDNRMAIFGSSRTGDEAETIIGNEERDEDSDNTLFVGYEILI